MTKYKRTKNLVKKCVDISKQLDLDIILVVNDKKTKRCREFHTSKEMTVEDIANGLQDTDSQMNLKYERIHADADCAMYQQKTAFDKVEEKEDASEKSEEDPESPTLSNATLRETKVMTSSEDAS